ncbi:hypothetical protein [Streptomyces sp. HC307]|uniref:hypothetical protein n=1 Tax=Streptomyces flavusporus TaxID=3385496 RepID=UPI0039171E85
MAGSFGFESGERYDVGLASGERVRLPAVRDAAEDACVIANGFSCKEQIRQETDQKALHLTVAWRPAHRGSGSQAHRCRGARTQTALTWLPRF